jgi:stringent starvation protein B
MNDAQGTSTRPYLLRALHDWCTDNGFTPYLAVHVGPGVQVPMEYVKNNEIVLNIGFEATSGLLLGNEFVEFKARFGGMAREIKVPVDHVVAIYARENGQGMAFPMPTEAGRDASTGEPEQGPVRGLRLASVESGSLLAAHARPGPGPAQPPASDGATDPSNNPPNDPGQPPSPPAPAGPASPPGTRPSLKRIK